ncbi:WAT1-related protein At2g39510 [Ziziphus jujuba]|uniref:WAT1-related protein n=1 Tax=Ziziphus jujuba TaxID=326968 RepID=A0A6P3ZDM1_ZIZJJ|nr:WAT1-related protein At2g39510 [Ziziphus jujuba]
MSEKSLSQMLIRAKPFIALIFLQFGYAGLSIFSKFALNHGMSQHVLVVYRHAIATAAIAPFAIFLDRKVRPKMTITIFAKIMLLGLLEPVIDQNLFYTGLKLTTATFTASMFNILPAFAFAMAWVLRLEKVKITSVRGLAKILGTIVTVGGAMFMTLVNGPALKLPWEKQNIHQDAPKLTHPQDTVKGAIMITAGCICWSAFVILQAITLQTYPAELSLTALMCLMGALEGSVVAVVLEWGNPSAWAIHMDFKFLTALYSGIVCSGIAYYIQGMVVKERGPVFVTAFNPLYMVIVAILGSLLLGEITYLGRVIGAVIIVTGLYMVLWGKSKDQDLQSESEPADINNKLAPDYQEMTMKTTKNQESLAMDGKRQDESV